MNRHVDEPAAGRRKIAQRGLALGERIALRRDHAAEALDVRVDFFDEHIAPELRAVRRGRKTLYSVDELRAWFDENADCAGHL